MKRRFLAVSIVLALAFSGTSLFATETAITDEKADNIVDNCTSIRDSLKRLQKDDSRSRVYLGQIYQHVIADYITPLNVRLVKNNLADSTLTEIQSEFTETREAFNRSFISYSKKLEELITINCKEKPEEFYKKLESVRTARKEVNKYTDDLLDIIRENRDTVKTVMESLEK